MAYFQDGDRLYEGQRAPLKPTGAHQIVLAETGEALTDAQAEEAINLGMEVQVVNGPLQPWTEISEAQYKTAALAKIRAAGKGNQGQGQGANVRQRR